jgi:5-methylcytosine-specific restriction endonuclease McrA
MSTVEYRLEPSPTTAVSFDWKNDAFYTSAVVLGIDIGLEGIGVWLREGLSPIYARTFVFETPDAAPLESRRGLRAGRRCRQAEQRREVMLKKFCDDFGLPWVEITDKGRDDGPFRFRWIATRKDTDGLRDIRAFAACLRHIIRHRGYDWHAPEDGGEYPWGDEAKAKDAIEWAKTAFCQQEHADKLLYVLTDCGWNDKERKSFEAALNQAVDKYNTKGIDAVLAEHFSQPKNNLRFPARRHNFPREMVRAHLEAIVKRHPQFLGGAERVESALKRLHEIINDHRKEPGALALRKVNRCPLAEILFDGPAPKCDSSKDRHIRRFKLLEFLATRTFVTKDGKRELANMEMFRWLLDDLLETDIRALASNGQIQRSRLAKDDFKKEFLAKHDPSGETKLARDNQSHNGEYFTQLTDLLWPKMSELGGRASLCGRSAEALFDYAIKEGFDATRIASRLKDKRFERSGKKMSFYEIRQTAAAGFGIYKQVEFLLGRWKKNAKPGDKPAVPGKLRQIFAQLIKDGILPPDKTAPDFVIVETVGDIPRNKVQAKEIQKEQTARRGFKDKLREQFKDFERGNLSREEANKRLLLYDQQRGICPYTGDPLGENPLAFDLEIDHVFPRSRGGISEMVNLVLTRRSTNGEKGERTPYEAFGGSNNSPQWRVLRDRLLKMQWNGQKREFFLRAENTPPDWGNMTRVAQLARQLRFEVARWLEIADDDAEVRRRVGTPTGYQTSVCRESWNDKLPEDFWPKKNRNHLRHHLWDAAILSHIPPGNGLNHVRCHGIFWHEQENNTGNIKMLALPGLGPDLKQFEAQTAGQCLVEKIQPAHAKKSRFEQWIYGRPDENGAMWARDPIGSLANKTNLLDLLREAGIDEKQLPTSRFNEWQEKRQAQFFTREEALSAFEALALPPEHQIPAPIFEEWWADRLKGEKKKVTAKSLRALLAKAHVPKTIVNDQQLSAALINRGDPGPLTCKDGTEIRGVSGTAKNMTPMAVVPHRNHTGETIGFKLAKESFIRAEIWVTEKRDKKGEIIKGKDGKPELEYHRRLIPHPRGLKNLSLRVLQCTGERLTWERRLTDAELVELGLGKKLTSLENERERLKKLQAKAVNKWQKSQRKKKDSDALGLAAAAASSPPQEIPEIWLSLRKIYTGLPPHAKRLKNANGANISRFAKGDLLLVPVNQSGGICKPSESPYREIWYRITAINASGQAEMQLAEFKQVKRLSEQDVKEGKSLEPKQEWLADVFQQQPGSDAVIAFLLQRTRANDKPPHSVK